MWIVQGREPLIARVTRRWRKNHDDPRLAFCTPFVALRQHPRRGFAISTLWDAERAREEWTTSCPVARLERLDPARRCWNNSGNNRIQPDSVGVN